ncbi:hypothetical protein GN956_G9438 [Arapaima gigas]
MLFIGATGSKRAHEPGARRGGCRAPGEGTIRASLSDCRCVRVASRQIPAVGAARRSLTALCGRRLVLRRPCNHAGLEPSVWQESFQHSDIEACLSTELSLLLLHPHCMAAQIPAAQP